MTGWLGVDPGGEATGIVLMRPAAPPVLLDHKVVLNTTGEVGHVYLAGVLAAIARIIQVQRNATSHQDTVRVAVERVNSPSGFASGRRHPIDPQWLLGCAIVQGAVMAAYPDAVLVAPGGNGHGAYAAYPIDLVTPGERRRCGWQTRPAGQETDMRHLRSAWDVARRASQVRPRRTAT